MGSARCLFAVVFLLVSSINAFALQSAAAPSEDGAAARATAGTASVLPRVIRFNSVLPELDGAPRQGVVTLTFTLYGDPQGGTPVWVETQNVQLEDRGRYTAVLGATTPAGLPVALFATGEARWLGCGLRRTVQRSSPGCNSSACRMRWPPRMRSL